MTISDRQTARTSRRSRTRSGWTTGFRPPTIDSSSRRLRLHSRSSGNRLTRAHGKGNLRSRDRRIEIRSVVAGEANGTRRLPAPRLRSPIRTPPTPRGMSVAPRPFFMIALTLSSGPSLAQIVLGIAGPAHAQAPAPEPPPAWETQVGAVLRRDQRQHRDDPRWVPISPRFTAGECGKSSRERRRSVRRTMTSARRSDTSPPSAASDS